jgi:hypothetical protein
MLTERVYFCECNTLSKVILCTSEVLNLLRFGATLTLSDQLAGCWIINEDHLLKLHDSLLKVPVTYYLQTGSHFTQLSFTKSVINEIFDTAFA